MATTTLPSTPIPNPAPSTPQTGTWRHPRFDEIARRQNASTFTDRNIRKVLYNAGGLVLMWFTERLVYANLRSLYNAATSLHPYSTTLYILLRILLVFNIGAALMPLVRRKDDLSDIPLTPAQRKLLGLPPSGTPPTPGSLYATPPRYPRSSTPLSGSPSSNYSNSPLSGKGSPAQGAPKGSAYSPNASPLLHKAIGGGLGGTRRTSYGSPSPLGPGRLEGPVTPSPAAGKAPSVGLNNKWLYDKGRGSPGGTRLFS